ncbi:hypothetical protein JKP88DRAFT_183161 [Tribonema minus]|uniref:Uncharacterized protein n=1 Tax=Tribonema minus TaxID=303371 RepID=A0A836CD62_9STRA|nr:hypothetical protein JKP88DRAFT_183161 [Tribonema minus]
MLSFVAMVFVSLGNKIMQKLETVPMRNYPNFLNLFTTFVYIPFSFAYIVPMVRCGSAITPDQLRVPKRVFAVMGALDGVSGIMQIFAATYLSGPLVILLTQSAIPISMAISKRLLRARYSLTQYMGAFTVALGILVVLGPSMADGGAGGSFGWSTVMILSCVPMALSSVYKEIALGESELDPIYLNGWVAIFQFAVSLPLALPAAMAGDPRVDPLHLPENIWDGLKCYVGVDSVEEGPYEDHCWPGGPLYVTLYLIFNITYNILIILILKYGSANILFMAMTITVPLGNAAFALPFIPGHTPLQSTDIIGLFAIMGGLVLYRFGASLCPRLARAAAPATKGDSNDAAKERRRPLLDIDERAAAADNFNSGSGNFNSGGKKRVAFRDSLSEAESGGDEENPFSGRPPLAGGKKGGKKAGESPFEYEM